MNKTIAFIKQKTKEAGINQRCLALMIGTPYQEINMYLNGKRSIPLRTSLAIDQALKLEKGTIAKMQLQEEIEGTKMKDNDKIKKKILRKIKENGGFWSYDGIPENIDDDSIIENGLMFLELEDMDLLFSRWNKAKIKKVWKERLVSQNKRLNILNFILAVKVFKQNKPKKFLSWAS